MSATAKRNPTARRNRITLPPAPGPGHEAIALCALGIWEAEGRPEGRAHDHWHQAEAQLTGHPAAAAGSLMDRQPRRSTRDSHEPRQPDSPMRQGSAG